MLLRNNEDLANLIRSIYAPLVLFSPYITGFSEEYKWAQIMVIVALVIESNYLLHIHSHNPFMKSRTLNVFIDLALGSTTAMTASNWRIQHVHGHHNPETGEYVPGYRWEMDKFTILGAISYSTRTIFGIFVLPIVESFKKGVLKNIKTPINYRWAFSEQLLFIAFVGMLIIVEPAITLGYLLPYYVVVLVMTRYVDYLNHFGCGEKKYEVSNNCLNSFFNKYQNNFGYHTAHHIYGNAHWSLLPQLHKKIENNIPAELVKSYSWSGYALPYHFYLSLRGKM